MRQIDLKATFLGPCPVTEYLKDQTGTVDHFGLETAFKVTLLNRRKWMIDNDEVKILACDDAGKFGNLAIPKQSCGPGIIDPDNAGMRNVEIDGSAQPEGFFQTRFRTAVATKVCLAGLATQLQNRLQNHRTKRLGQTVNPSILQP
jgi:hypothetical protein